MNGTTQDVEIKSNVPNARFFIDGKERGTTPGTVELERDRNYILEVKAPGYCTYYKELEGTLDAWWWGNLLIGGAIGFVLDGYLGSWHSFDNVDAELIPSTLNNENGLPIQNAPYPNLYFGPMR